MEELIALILYPTMTNLKFISINHENGVKYIFGWYKKICKHRIKTHTQKIHVEH